LFVGELGSFHVFKRISAPETSLIGDQMKKTSVVHIIILSICAFILFAGVAEAVDVRLEWDEVTASDMAGYRVYYGTTSGIYTSTVDVGNTTECIIQDLSLGPTYYFALAAYDTENLESGYSDEASFCACTYTISPTKAYFPSEGGDGVVQVTVSEPGCPWTTSNSASWITITAGQSGDDSGSVSYSLSANEGSAIRVGALTMAGEIFTTAQRGTPETLTITAIAGTGGTISPAGNVGVPRGASQTFGIEPKAGYWISYVRVDNIPVGAVSSYTFDNITKNHTIVAVFGKPRR
jgi:hypothetical protein